MVAFDNSQSEEDHNSVLKSLPRFLSRIGLIDERRGTEAMDLAWPVITTGALRVTLRLSDFLMVGMAAGAAGVAAVGFGFQFYFIGFAFALALSSGTLSLVSQHFGAEEYDEAYFVIKQSTWIAVLMSIPLMLFTWFYAEEMIGILGAAPDVIEMGAPYLKVLMLGVFFRFFSLISARGFAGAGDTVRPMYVRAVGVPSNIILNWLLIFGIGPFPELGVLGAGIGTAITNVGIAAIFGALLLSDRYDVRFELGGKQWDFDVVKQIFTVSLPLLGMRLARVLGRFPLLWILATFGTGAVAAYQVGQRVMFFALMPAWGFATASSTLVGQSLGARMEDEAEMYGWDTLKLAAVVMVSVGVVIAIFARPIAGFFVTEPEVISLSRTFIWVYAIGVFGFAVDRVIRGGLRGAGDTRWPMYGMILGTYGFLLPISYIFGIALGFGIEAVFIGILSGLFVPAVVSTWRFKTGKWKTVSRRIRHPVILEEEED